MLFGCHFGRSDSYVIDLHSFQFRSTDLKHTLLCIIDWTKNLKIYAKCIRYYLSVNGNSLNLLYPHFSNERRELKDKVDNFITFKCWSLWKAWEEENKDAYSICNSYKVTICLLNGNIRTLELRNCHMSFWNFFLSWPLIFFFTSFEVFFLFAGKTAVYWLWVK